MAIRPMRAEGATAEDGFSVVEILIGLGIMAILATAFAGALATALRAQLTTRTRTTATQLASQQVERARALDYANVGVVGGDPVGTLEPTASVALGGVTYTVTTTVAWLSTTDHTTGKQLEVSVTGPSGTVYATMRTRVAPSAQPAAGRGLITARIVDMGTNLPVSGATVTLSAGPSGTKTATSGIDGYVSFPSLLPTTVALPAYLLAATKSGYTTLAEDLTTDGGRTSLNAGQSVALTVRIYRPSTLTVDLNRANGTDFTQAATIVVSSRRGTMYQSTDSSGAATFSVVPGVTYMIGGSGSNNFSTVSRRVVPAGYPDAVTDTQSLSMSAPASRILALHVQNDATNVAIANVEVVAMGGPADVIVRGMTDASGNVNLDLPRGTTAYTVRAETQLGYDAGQILQVVDTDTAATLELARATAP